jgi:hypothetical protein
MKWNIHKRMGEIGSINWKMRKAHQAIAMVPPEKAETAKTRD